MRHLKTAHTFASRDSSAEPLARQPQGAELDYAAYTVNAVSESSWPPQRLLDALDTDLVEADTSPPNVSMTLSHERVCHGFP